MQIVVNVACHALRRWERAAALVCVGALLAVAVSCASTLLRPQLAFGGLWSPRAGGGGNQSAAAPADWRLLFCPPMRTPWSFDYLELAWQRAALLVNASGSAGAEGQPAARKLLQPGAMPQFVNASAQLTPVQLAAVQRYTRWSPGSMPWRDAGAIYVRLYKSGNDAFKGELDAQRFAWNGVAYSPSLVSHVATQQTSRPSTTTAHLILWMRQRW